MSQAQDDVISAPATHVFIEPHIAALCEHAEAIHIQRQAEQFASLNPKQGVLVQPGPKGGVLIRTASSLKGKLNRAVGSGKDGELDDKDLERLESTFQTIGLGPEIHVSPFASPETMKFLLSRGYAYLGRLNTYWCKVEEATKKQITVQGTSSPDLRIVTRVMSFAETHQFIEKSVAGFEDGGRPLELLRVLAELAAQREDTVMYVAELGGQIAGTAAMAVIDAEGVKVAHLYLDSTIPMYRGRGVQQALIQARLQDAYQRGVSIATTITRAGSGSARNAEKAGLALAYTTSIFGRS